MIQGEKSKTRSQRYETHIGYLEYEDLNDRVSIPIQIRERHLTQETKAAYLQGIGFALQVAMFSERDSIVMQLPFNCWHTTGVYQATLSGGNGGILPVGRFENELANDGDEIAARIIRHEFDEP